MALSPDELAAQLPPPDDPEQRAAWAKARLAARQDARAASENFQREERQRQEALQQQRFEELAAAELPLPQRSGLRQQLPPQAAGQQQQWQPPALQANGQMYQKLEQAIQKMDRMVALLEKIAERRGGWGA